LKGFEPLFPCRSDCLRCDALRCFAKAAALCARPRRCGGRDLEHDARVGRCPVGSMAEIHQRAPERRWRASQVEASARAAAVSPHMPPDLDRLARDLADMRSGHGARRAELRERLNAVDPALRNARNIEWMRLAQAKVQATTDTRGNPRLGCARRAERRRLRCSTRRRRCARNRRKPPRRYRPRPKCWQRRRWHAAS